MNNKLSKAFFDPYILSLCIFLIFTVCSLDYQTPSEILRGLVAINTSRCVLITDFMAIGGVGATFMNAVIIGVITIVFLIRLKIPPSGSVIGAIFLTIGFAMFGKNILNMIPITLGVWLYSKAVRKPFSDFYLTALLAATISPVTSELMFLDISYAAVNVTMGIVLGTLSGFIFPMVSEFLMKVHRGYNLYNMGFAGGILVTFIIAFLTSIGIEVAPEFNVSGGNNLSLGIILYFISCLLLLWGFALSDRSRILSDLTAMMKSGGTSADYYASYGPCVYINMGLLCALGTTLVLILGADINGPTIAGILAITGFGAYGKNLKSVLPLIAGAVIATFINKWEPVYTSNVLAILFSTGLAPIAGRHGAVWGIAAGFLHVCIVHHLGYLSSGLNLYNNGLSAGFVALLLIPVIEGISRIRSRQFDGL